MTITGLIVGLIAGVTATTLGRRAWRGFLHYLFSRGDQ